jgi:hypothetical protein
MKATVLVNYVAKDTFTIFLLLDKVQLNPS